MSQAQELKQLVGAEAERRAFLEEVGLVLPPAHRQRLERIFELVSWLLALLELKNLSIARLRQLCFGSTTESARKVCGKGPKAPKNPKAKGHGRNSHRSYTGARRVRVSHASLTAGQRCPECAKGKLRRRKQPAVAISVRAQPPVGALIHELEQLRCDTCGKVFTAATPPQAGTEKYDVSVGVMVGLMRYGSGMPFHRLERLQQSLGVPLPASVQWEQVDRVSRSLEPVFEHLKKDAAQSPVLFSDDTGMRVGALRKEIQGEQDPKRTGIFTTGIVGKSQDHGVSLFFTGRNHAGENLAQVLVHRGPECPPPLHMCDGLARNDPKGHPTVEAQCAVHARRNFVELESTAPEECRKVVESFSAIYRVEAEAKAAGLSPEQRLAAHQAQSQPVMEELRAWLTDQIEGRKVEPNSSLGGAIAYMRKRWTQLTQFLRVPGAPIDNNEAERILKKCILHRKNSLHYRTIRGAMVGDLFMSVTETCRINGVNPFEYMLAVVGNAAAAKANPQQWMPWNFQVALAESTALAV
jgi:transposase